jgi:hypothetical protein
LFGQAIPTVARTIAEPITNKLSPAMRDAVRILKNNGVELSLPQTMGNAWTAYRATKMAPGTAAAVAEDELRTAKSFTKAALSKIGVDAEEATPQVLQHAEQQIGSKFNAALDGDSLRPDNQLKVELSNALSKAQRVLADDSKLAPLKNALSTLGTAVSNPANGGRIPGRTYQTVRQDLQAIAGDPQLAPYASEIRSALDGNFSRTAQNPDNAKLFGEANTEWGRLSAITKATDARGNVSPGALWNAIKAGNVGAKVAKLGKGDQELPDLARAGRAIIPDTVGDSGTAQRSAAGVLPGLLAGQLFSGNLVGAAGTLAGGMLAPSAIRGAMTSKYTRPYLENGVTNSLLRGALTAPDRYGTLGAAIQRGVPAYAGVGNYLAPTIGGLLPTQQ